MVRRAANGHRRRQLVARVRRELPWVCMMPTCLCPFGRRIVSELDWRDPWSHSVDHVEPVWRRPDLEYVFENLRPAHRKCNQSAQPRKEEPSRDW